MVCVDTMDGTSESFEIEDEPHFFMIAWFVQMDGGDSLSACS